MKLTKKDLQEMHKDFNEFYNRQDKSQNEEYDILNIIQPDRQIKDYDYTEQAINHIIKKFNKYNKPPFPKECLSAEYVYNKKDLECILKNVYNPFLEYKQLPDWGDSFAVKLYINIYKI